MCGIAGFIGDLAPIQGRAALDAISYRGPDGSGEWYGNDNQVWLGHCRLAIIDLEGVKQPLSNEEKSLWITFNGCIYNYVELRDELSAKGYCFKTNSDTEVLLYTYQEYGEDCPSKLIGMFSFAIWDSREKKLFCARDRLGQKPFYYGHINQTFCFASEIKGLVAMDVIQNEPDMAALQEYLTFQVLLDDKTLFKGIHKLQPGHTLVYRPSANTIKLRKYWDIDYLWEEGQPELCYVERLKDLLTNSTRIQMRSDVPVGAYLSGGLDSSIIVCLMSKLKDPGSGQDFGTFKTFTGTFKEGRQYDESPYARIVSEHAGSEYHEVIPSASDFMDTLHRIIYHMDEPAAGPGVFPQYMVAKEASRHVKVVLGGQGGDEIFSGYARYQLCQLEDCLHGLIMGKGDTSVQADALSDMAPNLSMLEQYVPMMKSFWKDGLFDAQENRYFRLMNRSGDFNGLLQPDFMTAEADIFEKFRAVFHGSNATTFLERMQYFDVKVHLQGLCQVEDRTNMAWGLESRSPLMDYRIMELMAATPPAIKFKGGSAKYMLREASRGIVPAAIVDRKDKMGFPVPLNPWMKKDLHGYVRDVLLDRDAAINGLFDMRGLEKSIAEEREFGRGLWGALCLELWLKTFMSGKLSARPLQTA